MALSAIRRRNVMPHGYAVAVKGRGPDSRNSGSRGDYVREIAPPALLVSQRKAPHALARVARRQTNRANGILKPGGTLHQCVRTTRPEYAVSRARA